MGDRLSIDLLLHVLGLCMSLALGYSTFRLRPACLRLTNLVQFNITQVVGQFDNLPDTGRSLVNCEQFSSQPANVLQVSGRLFSCQKPV